MLRQAVLHFAGKQLWADPSGALVWPERRLIVVADLHLEKGTSGATQHVLLPPYDTQATLMRIAGLIERYAPRRIVSLGDGFHDAHASRRLADSDRAQLRRLTAACE